jgi:hypothetical protein
MGKIKDSLEEEEIRRLEREEPEDPYKDNVIDPDLRNKEWRDGEAYEANSD